MNEPTVKIPSKTHIPLFWKFAIAVSSMVILFGTLNLLFIRYQVYLTFEAQIEKQGISIAKSVAEQVTDPILFNELAKVNQILVRTKTTYSDIEYLMILAHNNVLAHTLPENPSYGLINANSLSETDSISIKIIHRKTVIRDFATPIMGGRLGVVRVGMNEEIINKQLSQATRLFILLVFLLLLMGVFAAFILSYIITNPVKSISKQASLVNLKSLESKENSINLEYNNTLLRLKNLFNLSDEIDVLGYTFRDMISRLNSAYIEIEKTRESLTQTEKMASVGTLAAGLAHEINNPLAGMKSCLRRISEKPDNIKQNQEYIEMMTEAVERISKVVEDLLNFSRKHELNYSRIDIIKSLDNSTALIGFQLSQSRIKLIKRYDSSTLQINGSSNHLEQVFVNALLNCIDAINERKMMDDKIEGQIIINARRGNDYINIDFIDNGIGMPEEKIGQMFDPFFTLKKIKQGTGLGLAVCQNIIQSHYGQISGSNTIEGGFKLSIVLPIKLDM